MLRRTHVEPFLSELNGALSIEFLEADAEGRVVAFCDRLCRLVRRLEGRPRAIVTEALRRQERRVRDARRLAGISKSLLDRCRFEPPHGAARAEEVRKALFRARGKLWPPVPGDAELPYREAATELQVEPDEVARLLYADRPDAHVLAKAASLDGRLLLERYNLDLARGVLLQAIRTTLTARGGWRDIFRAVKLARLMYRIEPADRPRRGSSAYRIELTGPAAPFITRPERYGARLAQVVPALTAAPGWSLRAEVLRDGRLFDFRLDGNDPVGRRRRGRRYDSRWERALAEEFRAKIGAERQGWSLRREKTPLSCAGELFLPDFTLRHQDGREALVEIVGFWTPEYLETKLRKLRAAGPNNLILVVYRGLAAGADTGEGAGKTAGAESDTIQELEARFIATGVGEVLWFVNKPRIAPVIEAAERVARRPARC